MVAKGGGAFARLVPIFRLGAGGPVGSGRQYWSFISLTDEVAALTWLLEGQASGPVNLTAPNPVTNAEATRALAALLHRKNTGRGQHIDVSMLESLVEWMGYPLYYSYQDASPPPRSDDVSQC